MDETSWDDREGCSHFVLWCDNGTIMKLKNKWESDEETGKNDKGERDTYVKVCVFQGIC
jgi:hypothetical protein